MTFKEARAEAREIALRGYHSCPIAWNKNSGYYPEAMPAHGYRLTEYTIGWVEKSGAFIKLKEYEKKRWKPGHS